MTTHYTFYVLTDDDLSGKGREQIQNEVKRQVISKVVLPSKCNCEELINNILQAIKAQGDGLNQRLTNFQEQVVGLLQNQGLSEQDRALLRQVQQNLVNVPANLLQRSDITRLEEQLTQLRDRPVVQPSDLQALEQKLPKEAFTEHKEFDMIRNELGGLQNQVIQSEQILLNRLGEFEGRVQTQMDNLSQGILEITRELRQELSNKPPSDGQLLSAIKAIRDEMKEQTGMLQQRLEAILPGLRPQLEELFRMNRDELGDYFRALLAENNEALLKQTSKDVASLTGQLALLEGSMDEKELGHIVSGITEPQFRQVQGALDALVGVVQEVRNKFLDQMVLESARPSVRRSGMRTATILAGSVVFAVVAYLLYFMNQGVEHGRLNPF